MERVPEPSKIRKNVAQANYKADHREVLTIKFCQMAALLHRFAKERRGRQCSSDSVTTHFRQNDQPVTVNGVENMVRGGIERKAAGNYFEQSNQANTRAPNGFVDRSVGILYQREATQAQKDEHDSQSTMHGQSFKRFQ